MYKFPEEFSFIDFTSLRDTRDGSFILGVIFKSISEADNWGDLMRNEPHSFSFEVTEDGGKWFVFRFTNQHSDYRFQVPLHIQIHHSEFQKNYQILICLILPDKTLQQLQLFQYEAQSHNNN